jgi:hypothetical protein
MTNTSSQVRMRANSGVSLAIDAAVRGWTDPRGKNG